MKTRQMSLTIAACCGLGISPSFGAAKIVFDQPHVEIELSIDKQEANVMFYFTNTSRSAVSVLEVITECDCIQTSSLPVTIEAGQTGEITLKFRARIRNGAEVIRAEVVTDTGEIYPVSVTANWRSYIEVTPRALHWRKGEQREPREFAVSSTGLGKLRFTRAVAAKGAKAEVLPGKDLESKRVLVTPPIGGRPFQDILLVTAVLEETNETKIYDLHVSGD